MNRRRLLITALLLATTFTLLVLRSQAGAPRNSEAQLQEDGAPAQDGAQSRVASAALKLGKLLRAEELPPEFEALKKQAHPLDEPGPDDWLSEHAESGQTAASYKASDPVRPDSKRRTLLLQPIGTLSDEEKVLVADTAEFLTVFYGLPVRVEEALVSEVIPKNARRVNQYTHKPQVHTAYLLNGVLKPLVTSDVLAVIGLTAEDLYPDPAWNFVFGEASLEDRVGVWSFNRFGDLKTERLLVLDRTLKTAVHEFGHMLGMEHCVAYACVMNGINHLDESDWTPSEPCPICLHKLTWNTGVAAAERYEKVIAFYEAKGLTGSATQTRKRLALLKAEPR